MTSSHNHVSGLPGQFPSGGIFDSMSGDAEVDRELTDGAFVRAVITFEAVVMAAQANHGIIPQEAANLIEDATASIDMGSLRIGSRAEQAATPVIAVVEAIRAAVTPALAGLVHHGLSSQDCIDTAFSMMHGRALDVIGPRIATVIGRLSRVAERHAATPMLARLPGRPAAPTTYGWQVCQWIEGLEHTVSELGRARESLAVQLGGPTDDLADMGPHPRGLVADVAEVLELEAPRTSWHNDRSRVLQVASACVQTINACAKIATDVAAMASHEVDEVVIGDEDQSGRSTSSPMPPKRNSAAAISIRSAATMAPGLLANVAAAGVQEPDRSAGRWQSEWRAMRELVHLTGGAAHELSLLERDTDVNEKQMAQNLSSAGFAGSPLAAERRTVEYLQRFN
ncbi:lyase family protein [Cumulibacter soli]|uniref:lyase family protein n=1 Tax=Cumulibacter soli TaxID=2546344 RepID=UPI0010683231|nr:lyase family protein [Cumulibacter soli]